MPPRLLRLAPILVFGLLPAIGILFLAWDWREVIVLYWFENVGLGVAIVARILRAPLAATREDPYTTRGGYLRTFFLYFGLFYVVQGVFVFLFVFGVDVGASTPGTAGPLDWPSIVVVTLIGTAVHVAAALSLQAPLRPRDRLITTAYQRVNVLHAAILVGGIAIALLGLPSAAALVLVVLHTTVDVVSWCATRVTPRPPEQYAPRHLNVDPDGES